MDYFTSHARTSGLGAVLLGDDASDADAWGVPDLWCMMWCMKRTNIYLAEGQAEALDRAAEAEGVSRAELIRALIDRAIGGEPGSDLATDLAAIQESFGVITVEQAFSRGRDERMDYLDGLADA